MPTLQYATQVSPDGSITLPPEFYGRKVVVSVNEECSSLEKKYATDQPRDKDWRPDPAAVRRFAESRTMTAPDLTDEEIERLKHERRMRKMK